MILAGCSAGGGAGEGGQDAAQASAPAQARNYPAGGAQVLSVVGASTVEGSGPFEVALNCTVALRMVGSALSDLQVAVGDTEMAALRQAQAVYQSRLTTAGAQEGHSPRDLTAMVEERLQDAADNPAPQLQLVTPCLRQLAASQ